MHTSSGVRLPCFNGGESWCLAVKSPDYKDGDFGLDLNVGGGGISHETSAVETRTNVEDMGSQLNIS